jgi:tetratricopeptide (TPR) repeat protein
MVLIAALYVRTIAFDYVYDDVGLVLNPPPGWKSAWDVWNAVRDSFSRDIFGSVGHSVSAYYRPLPSLFVLTVRQLTCAPGWFHLIAIGIHLVVFYLAYVLGRLLFRDERLALLAALFYALQPAKVESVAWIGSAFCDGFAAMFFFGALICYLRWKENGGKWLAVSLLAFSIAMLSKETMAVIPMLIGLYHWLTARPGRRLRSSIFLMIPYAAVVAGYMLLRRLALTPLPATDNHIRPSFDMSVLWSAPSACWWYLKHLLLPGGLSVMYEQNAVLTPTLRNFVLPLVGLALVSAAACWMWTRRRSADSAFLIGGFVLTLAPYIAMSPKVHEHDRYLHLASYFFCAFLAYVILRAGRTAKGNHVYWRGAAVLILAVLWSASVWHESSFWEDEFSLWGRAVTIAPSQPVARIQLASLYDMKGDVGSALRVIGEGLLIRPQSPNLWEMRGFILYQNKQYPEARKAFLKVIETSADYGGKPANDVGDAKAESAYHLGLLALAEKDSSSAEKWFRVGVDLRPDSARYRSALANALRRSSGQP